ncbi:MAG: sialate O-acetylesterase [Lachnospiraceae bacterium]|nr:sialate O-acetylesterase [Lachnospiraceae bacterium]
MIFFGGQSNMQGQTEARLTQSFNPDALEYRFLTDGFVPVSDPVGEDIHPDDTEGYPFTAETDCLTWLGEHITGSSCYGNSNLVPSFLRAYRKRTDTPTAAVHIAKGSTVIADWLPGTAGYGILLKKSLSAIRKAEESFSVRHRYFVWLQGESDAIASTPCEVYAERLRLLGESLRRDLGITVFGVIRVGRFVGDERDDAIMNAQAEVCRTDAPFFRLLTDRAAELNLDPTCMNPFVQGHFSAHGLDVLGSLAGDALGRIAVE